MCSVCVCERLHVEAQLRDEDIFHINFTDAFSYKYFGKFPLIHYCSNKLKRNNNNNHSTRIAKSGQVKQSKYRNGPLNWNFHHPQLSWVAVLRHFSNDVATCNLSLHQKFKHSLSKKVCTEIQQKKTNENAVGLRCNVAQSIWMVLHKQPPTSGRSCIIHSFNSNTHTHTHR